MGEFNWFDCAVLAIILVSSLLGVWRGIVSEILSLLAWIVAFFIARAAANEAAQLLAPMLTELNNPALRYMAGFAAVFAGVLILFAIIRLLISSLLRALGLGWTDRTLGALFGLGRGLLVAWLGVLLAGLTSLPQQSWWRAAALTPPLETAVVASKPWLPKILAERLRYRTTAQART
jgi:membrane protein required for colicin V production